MTRRSRISLAPVRHAMPPTCRIRSTTIAALAVLVLAGALAVLGVAGLSRKDAPQSPTQAGDASTTADRPPTPPGTIGWIAQAMAECEVVAKQNADTLYFLIVPVKPSAIPCPAGARSRSATSASRRAAGLGGRAGRAAQRRAGALPRSADVRGQDPDTNTTYKWKPANGVSELKSRESGLAHARDRARQQRRDRVGPDHRDRQGLLLLDQSADPSRRAQR